MSVKPEGPMSDQLAIIKSAVSTRTPDRDTSQSSGYSATNLPDPAKQGSLPSAAPLPTSDMRVNEFGEATSKTSMGALRFELSEDDRDAFLQLLLRERTAIVEAAEASVLTSHAQREFVVASVEESKKRLTKIQADTELTQAYANRARMDVYAGMAMIGGVIVTSIMIGVATILGASKGTSATPVIPKS